MLAAWKGELETVTELLRAGAQANTQDQVHVHYVCTNEVCDCVRECWYNHVCCMQEGLTSLMLATQNAHLKVVEALLDTMADPDITEKVRVYEQVHSFRDAMLTCHMSTDCRMECSVLCRQVRLS